MAKNAAKNAAKDAAKDAAKKPVKNTVKEAVKKPEKKPAPKPEKKPAKDSSADMAAKGAAKKPAKDTVKETAKKPAKEAVADVFHDDSADPIDEGLRLIQSKPEGILQSELWKELGVDSRKCSRIVKRLEDGGLIERLDFKKDGIKTYLLRAKQQPVNPADLLAGDELIPCIGCELECVVEECHPLMDWMYQLAIVEHTEE